MTIIKSQVWRRRLDRTQPNMRSHEWVTSVAQVQRRVPDSVLRDFEQIVARVESRRSQDHVASTLAQSGSSACSSLPVLSSSDQH